nr:nucleotide sugar dehydrogenase [Frigoriglobus tundricola]
MFAVADAIGAALRDAPPGPPGARVVVTKSTVPVGTNAQVAERLAAAGAPHVDVASNPEFLKEGAAIEDFMRPDRVVVGTRRPEVSEVLRELYAPFLRTERPFLVMSPESAEMTKYAANAMLATKISFINEMANLCDRLGADINDVRKGIGHDQRIGFPFLFPGPGYGGSCFPKDVEAIIAMGRRTALPLKLMQAVDAVNDAQKQVLFTKIQQHFGAALAGRTLALWGLAFKPRTDDIREARAGPHRRAAGGRGPGPGPRPRSDGQRPRALRRHVVLRRPPVRRPRGGRRPGGRHRVARVPQPGFRGHEAAPDRPGRVRRPQRVRAPADGGARLHLLRDRPRRAEVIAPTIVLVADEME